MSLVDEIVDSLRNHPEDWEPSFAGLYHRKYWIFIDENGKVRASCASPAGTSDPILTTKEMDRIKMELPSSVTITSTIPQTLADFGERK